MKAILGYFFTALLIFACTPVYAQVIEGTSARQIETRRNYIKDGAAEAYTRGFVLYNDGAVAEAIDGTGGTPTVAAVALTNTTPIADKKSFLITKAASNVQGQGYSIPFTIDRKDRAKVLDVEIDYTIPSGTFVAGTSSADSDLVVQVYDVTNAKLIPLSSKIFLSNSSTLEDKFKASFQSSPDSTSYRLIIHHATTSSSAFTFKFELGVYPSRYVYGTPITDWRLQTGVTINLTNSTLVAYSRRVGDSAELSVRVTFSAAPGAVSSTNLSLPGGLNIDTGKIIGNVIGFGRHEDTGNARYAMQAVILSSSAIGIRNFQSSGAFVSDADVTHTVPFVIGSGDFMDINVSFPVIGWSSSVQMSDQADTRVVAANVAMTGTQAVTNATSANVLLTTRTIENDTHGSYNTSTGFYTVPVSGIYRTKFRTIVVSAVYANSSSFIGVNLKRNNSAVDTIAYYQAPAAQTIPNQEFKGDRIFSFRSGDTIIVELSNSSGSSATMSTAYIEFERLSGPSAIAAVEKINVIATNAAGQSLTGNTFVDVIGWVEEEDTHNAFNNTTGVFTAPAPGTYEFSLQLTKDSTLLTTGQGFGGYLFWNSNRNAENTVYGNGNNVNQSSSLSRSIVLAEGQQVKVQAYCQITCSLSSSSLRNFISIKRIK